MPHRHGTQWRRGSSRTGVRLMARIMIIDDDAGALAFAARALSDSHDVVACLCASTALAQVAASRFDVLLTDLSMPATDGFEVLRSVAQLAEPPPVIVLTAMDRARATLDAMRLGARDYIVKPSTACEIRAAVERVVSGGTGAPESAHYGLIGSSPELARLRRMIPLLARSRESVLIIGETGTGKELFARALHDQSPRSSGPFIAHNAAATPSELAESLFFGHTRGSFSGAIADHAGLFEQAHGGTLFLDELDSLPLAIQPKLLRTLEGLRVQRVGGSGDRVIDVRIVAASSVDPGTLVERGQFRADLYYRLRQLEIVIPPLRQRLEDIPELAEHLLAESSREQGHPVALSAAAAGMLKAHDWPGNVRELRHALRGAATLADHGTILPQHLPRILQRVAPRIGSQPHGLADAEHGAILRALESAGGNQSRAAMLLGIDRGTLARKLKQWQV